MIDSIATSGLHSVTYSGQNSRTVNSQPEQQNIEDRHSVSAGEKSDLQTVHISQEALTKFQAYAEQQKADGAASTWQRTAEGAAVAQQGPVSEAEQTAREALIAASHEEMRVEHAKMSYQVWGNLSAVTDEIDQTYSSFLDQLAEDNPDLKDAYFGFSVNKDGTLFVTQAEGLNKEQIERLNKALNDDDGLVKLANDLANAQIAVFDFERGFNTQKTFNRDNYGQTIDMGVDLLTRYLARSAPHDESASDIHQRNWDSNWLNQL
ncbi:MULTISPECIES: hypothetical protein [unclassified Symbiopectobacterium]|uniref:hypothetical protein n=1 Tax=unclassified Symbiopectobacterium TaxID=2794573 RepID=UPI0022263989|nr:MULTISPECIES: hypothetical protein [unclassified Symbiopectobacterium]MCW2475796.1 hypothetical protein [Candidatus Symbiopectobacterium sp. NZEC151]MCW2482158.1 hypothetical protein [Candidatus Symbiopectobacterium sp. NZEC135]